MAHACNPRVWEVTAVMLRVEHEPRFHEIQFFTLSGPQVMSLLGDTTVRHLSMSVLGTLDIKT